MGIRGDVVFGRQPMFWVVLSLWRVYAFSSGSGVVAGSGLVAYSDLVAGSGRVTGLPLAEIGASWRINTLQRFGSCSGSGLNISEQQIINRCKEKTSGTTQIPRQLPISCHYRDSPNAQEYPKPFHHRPSAPFLPVFHHLLQLGNANIAPTSHAKSPAS